MQKTYRNTHKFTPEQEQDYLWAQFDQIWPQHEPEMEQRTLAFELAEVERKAIQLAIEHALGNQSKAARELGMGRTLLIHKLKKYDLI